MVRSKSEIGLPERFYLAEQIRTEKKYIDVSLGEIGRQLESAGVFDGVFEHDTEDDDGKTVSVELKLNLHTRSRNVNSWSASLKLHGIRIDCIDYENKFTTTDGVLASGWHRHDWDAAGKSAERKKVPLNGFDNELSSIDYFVIRVTTELRIRLNRSDHGNSGLLFD